MSKLLIKNNIQKKWMRKDRLFLTCGVMNIFIFVDLAWAYIISNFISETVNENIKLNSSSMVFRFL